MIFEKRITKLEELSWSRNHSDFKIYSKAMVIKTVHMSKDRNTDQRDRPQSPEIDLPKYSQLIFNKSVQVIQWRNNSFSTNGAGDFPGGAVVKNPPANAGDTGFIPGLGRSHMPWNNKACVPQLLSLHSRAH